MLGLNASAIHPLTLTLNVKIFFKGFSQVATVKTEPKLKMGEGVPFVNGTDK
jgi:Reverse transcriptase (RNA-dependent DNA polymerase)